MKQETAKQIYSKKEYLTKGKRGYIYVAEYKDKKHIIKEKHPDSTAKGTIENEAHYNKILNKLGIGPEFYYKSSDNKYLIREYVYGVDIYEWINQNIHNNTLKNRLKKIIIEIFKQTRILDKNKINKLELTRPHKDILITDVDKPVIIDFERCKKSEKVKNVTQICQFIAKGRFFHELKQNNMYIDSDKLIELATNYKKEGYKEKDFKKILTYIKSLE